MAAAVDAASRALPAWSAMAAPARGNLLYRVAEILDRRVAPALRAVSFTGSCSVGEWLHGEASKRRLRIQLEMGGKNPTIVLADAPFEQAVENTVNAAFFSTGQKCTATSRAIVEDAIYDRFVAAVVERTRKLKVGDGMQPGVEIGPCVDQSQMETVLRYIEIGRKECGEPLCGGRRLK